MNEEKNTQTPPSTNASGDDKIIAAIGYIWILFLIPLFLKKNNKYCLFHAKQGLVLFVAGIILMVINIIPVLGWLISFFGWIIIVIFSILGFINALQGREWKLPFLSSFAEKINL